VNAPLNIHNPNPYPSQLEIRLTGGRIRGIWGQTMLSLGWFITELDRIRYYLSTCLRRALVAQWVR